MLRAALAWMALPFLLAAEPKVWPPRGPVWESDPAAAFARARREGKGVLCYVATEA
jgi:hypothetical protein